MTVAWQWVKEQLIRILGFNCSKNVPSSVVKQLLIQFKQLFLRGPMYFFYYEQSYTFFYVTAVMRIFKIWSSRVKLINSNISIVDN